jgi:hypothetical protein
VKGGDVNCLVANFKMIRTIIILFITFYFSINYLVGQITPGSLQNNDIQNELLKKTIQFDSLILVDISSYWKDDHSIQGFGFIQSKPYKVTINFKTIYDSIVRLEYKNLKKNKIRNQVLISKLEDINIEELKTLNPDSLEIITRTGSFITASDGPEWSLIIIDNEKKKVFLKQVYMPESSVKTDDKLLFINTINEIEAIIEE